MQALKNNPRVKIRAIVLAVAVLAMLVLRLFAHPARAATATNSPLTRDQLKAQLQELNAPDTADGAGLTPDQAQKNDATIDAAEALPPDEYYRAKIELLESTRELDVGGTKAHVRVYKVRLLDGKDKGKEVSIETNDLDVTTLNRATLKAGDKVVVVKSYKPGNASEYYIVDNYRIPSLVWIALIFVLAAVVFGKWRGFTSMIGLGVTVGVIMLYVVPQIMGGADPLRTSLIATFGIAAVSLFLAHGFNRRTTIAFVGTLITLAISAWMAISWVSWASLFGTGSEDALFLQGVGLGDINLRGLLLGGIMLGVLGILDDITTAQSAIVEELKHANPSFKFAELYKRGLSVGKEHISSLINTLFLAYAGASLPLFLLFTTSKTQPVWFILNSETIAEEIVRTIVGSVCLILAVPITTMLAASYYGERKVRGEPTPLPHHHH